MTWTNANGNGTTGNAPVSGAEHNVNTFAITTQAVGNLVIAIVTNHDPGTVSPTGISSGSSRVSWAQATPLHNGTYDFGNWSGMVFFGTVLSVGSTTETTQWSGTPSAFINTVALEFSTTVGGWALDTWTSLDNAGAGQATWPSLTAAGSGELYLGFAWNSGSSGTTSTAGFFYNSNSDAASNAMAYSLSVGPGTVTGPTWTDSTQDFGLFLLVAEQAPGSGGGPQALPYIGGQVRRRSQQLRRQTIFPVAATSLTTAIAYATSQDIAGAGAGTWVNPANAAGAPDGSYATWTAT